MHNPNGIRVLYLLAPAAFLLIPISALVVILERISQYLFNSQLNGIYRSGHRELTLDGPSDSTVISLNINVGPTIAILGVCVFAFVAGVLACCGIWELRRVEGAPAVQRFWAWVSFIMNIITVGLAVGVLAWASAVQADEGWKGREDVEKDGQRFTRETWACQIEKFFPQEEWAGPPCGLAVRILPCFHRKYDAYTNKKATRFMLIPLAVSSILVMVSTWLLTRDRGGIKWLLGGKGRYAGFPSIYEMGPHGPPPAYPPGPQSYPMPQTYPGPQQYGAQQYPMPQPYPQQYQGYPSAQVQPPVAK